MTIDHLMMTMYIFIDRQTNTWATLNVQEILTVMYTNNNNSRKHKPNQEAPK